MFPLPQGEGVQTAGDAQHGANRRGRIAGKGCRAPRGCLGPSNELKASRQPLTPLTSTLLHAQPPSRLINSGLIVHHLNPPVLSKFRGNVRLSVQRKCHSLKPRWYQMTTLRKPPGIVALVDPQCPYISLWWPSGFTIPARLPEATAPHCLTQVVTLRKW